VRDGTKQIIQIFAPDGEMPVAFSRSHNESHSQSHWHVASSIIIFYRAG
jgi:hypothetical protein